MLLKVLIILSSALCVWYDYRVFRGYNKDIKGVNYLFSIIIWSVILGINTGYAIYCVLRCL